MCIRDSWYLDAACTRPFAEGSIVPEAGLSLYGRNRVTVSYALTDRTVALFADRELFADEARLEPLARIEPPPSRELFSVSYTHLDVYKRQTGC